MSEARAVAVVDLGFGDSGKGLLTDALVRRREARIVVRWNGGAQAGHNVVTADGRHHTFSQIGAGSFVPGVLTFLGPEVVVHPGALLLEARHLSASGVDDGLARLHVHRDARVITPYHQSVGRVRELARGDARHGSCGVGFGEAVSDSLEAGAPLLRMGDLEDRERARAILGSIRARKQSQAAALSLVAADPRALLPELEVFEAKGVEDAWLDGCRHLLSRLTLATGGGLRARLREAGTTILEGSQGMLLDERFGFHPHTTWSDCRFTSAEALLRDHGFEGELTRLGVLRTYLTRHGAGPFPTRTRDLDEVTPEPHNSNGGWQGLFRRGWPDAVLARYAAEAAGGLDALALTHVDALERRDAWQLGRGYRTRAGETIERLELPGSLEEAEALGSLLSRSEALLEPLPPAEGGHGVEALVERLEEATSAPVKLVSRGPTAGHVEGALDRRT